MMDFNFNLISNNSIHFVHRCKAYPKFNNNFVQHVKYSETYTTLYSHKKKKTRFRLVSHCCIFIYL